MFLVTSTQQLRRCRSLRPSLVLWYRSNELHENVLRLNIPVNEAIAMHMLESSGYA